MQLFSIYLAAINSLHKSRKPNHTSQCPTLTIPQSLTLEAMSQPSFVQRSKSKKKSLAVTCGFLPRRYTSAQLTKFIPMGCQHLRIQPQHSSRNFIMLPRLGQMKSSVCRTCNKQAEHVLHISQSATHTVGRCRKMQDSLARSRVHPLPDSAAQSVQILA